MTRVFGELGFGEMGHNCINACINSRFLAACSALFDLLDEEKQTSFQTQCLVYL